MGDRQDGTEPMTAEVAVMMLNSPNASESLVAEAVATLAGLVSSKVDQWRDATGQDGNPMAWHFVGYRSGSPQGNRHNPPEAPQYQGVVFADGTVAMRWLIATRSWSVWDTFADMFDAHGRPEYGTEIHWPNGAPTEARDVIERAAQDYRDRVAAEAHTAERIARELRGPDPDAGIVRTDSGEHYDPTQDNTGPEPAAAEPQRETWRAARAQLAQALGLDPHMTWPELIADVRRVPPFTTTKEQR
jgi:hypothetical protein